VDNIFLSLAELEKIRSVILSPRLDVSRDLFLIGCFTGLRVGNYLHLSDIHVNREEGFIQTVVNKDGPRVKIPLHPVICDILDKYGGFPPAVCSQRLNINIKAICKLAEITEVIEKRVNGKVVVVQKCDLVTSHTARRSLATNLYLQGVPVRYIMSITGHKTEATCYYYVKQCVCELYDQVKSLDFWKKGPVQ
jgi:integrase